jgi:poly(A) polymerase
VHGIDPKLVDERALNVVRTLKQAGFEAYIVGGAVRDLLVGLRPKDFDVATNATPEQVKGLFRRAFIIGRRFRIVHVVFGRGREHEVIEVSTFRAYLDNAAAEQVAGNEKTSRSELAGMKHAVDSTGRVLRDNVWGPQEEDAVRRDFTINAMYYDPKRRWWWITTAASRTQKKRAAHDRRPGHALPRRPGAHHPRRALWCQAQRAGVSSWTPRPQPLLA